MSQQPSAVIGADILTPEGIVRDHALLHDAGRIESIVPKADLGAGVEVIELDGGVLIPGFVDLQVNGGGGLMFNNAPDVETLRRMAEAHARIGATSILPTLITDTPEITEQAIAATIEAVENGVPGIIGLHLEGPHLSRSRKGAHEANLIRPMEQTDLERLLAAAQKLPVLKVTVAPESVSGDQIRTLSEAGIVVSLGHTDASYEDCRAAAEAGARCVTHLFNAQSQMGNREPGTVGAALALGELSAGLIADTIHVHPASMRSAIRAKNGPGRVFLVSDAMATAGSDIASFMLNGREILRSENRLTLSDGTLAGAHLELLVAVKNVAELTDVSFETAVEMASLIPAELVQRKQLGRLSPGSAADILHIGVDRTVQGVWQNGSKLLN